MLSPDREGKITGSMVGAILGLNKYCSRQKAYRLITGEEKFEGNEMTQWGNDNEENALNAFENELGVFCTDVLDDQKFIIHPDHKWLGCTPDGFVDGGKSDDFKLIIHPNHDMYLVNKPLVEFKCPFYRVIPDAVPHHYYAQCQINMEISDSLETLLIYWTPDAFRVFKLKFDSGWGQIAVKTLHNFWTNNLEKKEPPKRFSKSVPKPTLPEMKWEIIHDRKN